MIYNEGCGRCFQQGWCIAESAELLTYMMYIAEDKSVDDLSTLFSASGS
jgi:hypothetical protein